MRFNDAIYPALYLAGYDVAVAERRAKIMGNSFIVYDHCWLPMVCVVGRLNRRQVASCVDESITSTIRDPPILLYC